MQCRSSPTEAACLCSDPSNTKYPVQAGTACERSGNPAFCSLPPDTVVQVCCGEIDTQLGEPANSSLCQGLGWEPSARAAAIIDYWRNARTAGPAPQYNRQGNRMVCNPEALGGNSVVSIISLYGEIMAACMPYVPDAGQDNFRRIYDTPAGCARDAVAQSGQRQHINLLLLDEPLQNIPRARNPTQVCTIPALPGGDQPPPEGPPRRPGDLPPPPGDEDGGALPPPAAPTRWWIWVLVGVAVLLAAGAVVFFVARSRRQTADPLGAADDRIAQTVSEATAYSSEVGQWLDATA